MVSTVSAMGGTCHDPLRLGVTCPCAADGPVGAVRLGAASGAAPGAPGCTPPAAPPAAPPCVPPCAGVAGAPGVAGVTGACATGFAACGPGSQPSFWKSRFEPNSTTNDSAMAR